ncbi:MAG: hypothetical protein M8860_05510 [marine benthic group bacterium]|nr:hypothetical protein [Candidatus Carthagonibacter metallireducens]
MIDLLVFMTVAIAAACANSPAEPGDRSTSVPGDTVSTPPPPASSSALVRECDNPGTGWLWCDDFEQDRLDSYFEHNSADGDFVRASGTGVEESFGMRTRFRAGQDGAGWMHLAIGKTPQSRMRPADGSDTVHRDVYWRFLVRNQDGWTGGGGHKLTRARGFASPDSWQQAFEGPLWSGKSDDRVNYLVLDPVSGTDDTGSLLDLAGGSLGAGARWLGSMHGVTALFADSSVGPWYCVEVHLRLNDPGVSNGVFEYWIDGNPEARRDGLNWVGQFTEYGINTISLDNYWNGGAPQDQERYLDNFVVGTSPIGCP